MTSQLVQSYIDKENTTSHGTTNGKARFGSVAGRQGIPGKTFSVGSSAIATPRRALGNLSNDATRLASGLGNSQKKPIKSVGGSGVFRKPLGSLSKTPGLSMKNPSSATPSSQMLASKHKIKPQVMAVSSNLVRPTDSYPEIETMHIYQDKEPEFESLPPEDCLSVYLDRLSSLRVPPMPHPQTKAPQGCPTDFSHLQLEANDRFLESGSTDTPVSCFDVDTPLSLDSCIDLPPLDSVDFMDINNILLWDQQGTD
ncbi:uncharacterized protein LOC110981292 [Acanthaster planci]|uniref:Uncharacterized protein LOC110981292 n=1 Tax=Acanthaster planci TaxID=133434 RepID=A0A8B7YMG4_ACAPL|nr:uncharacterized protein LOC110981292 [Acanthaster planci]